MIVLVHEAGHLIVSKIQGVTVEVFSIGIGKKLFSFRKNDTEYRISLFPLGGYCKLKGNDELKQAIEDDLDSIPAAKGSIYSLSPLKRIPIFLAGPVFNFLLALLLLVICEFIPFSYSSPGNKIILLSDYNMTENTDEVYPSDKAELKTGDTIINFNGSGIKTFYDLQNAVRHFLGGSAYIIVRRENEEKKLLIKPDLNKNGQYLIGVIPWYEPESFSIVKNSIADKAGLRAGDTILKINGHRIKNNLDVRRFFGEKKLEIKYRRNNEILISSLLIDNSTGIDNSIEHFGIIYRTGLYKKQVNNIFSAVGHGFGEAFFILFKTVQGPFLLISGKIDPAENLAGPIRIPVLLGEMTSASFKAGGFVMSILNFSKMISMLCIAFFFMNLLPIPALDGGHILISIIEGIKRRPIKPKNFYRYQLAGLFLIIVLACFIILNDITSIRRGMM